MGTVTCPRSCSILNTSKTSLMGRQGFKEEKIKSDEVIVKSQILTNIEKHFNFDMKLE